MNRALLCTLAVMTAATAGGVVWSASHGPNGDAAGPAARPATQTRPAAPTAAAPTLAAARGGRNDRADHTDRTDRTDRSGSSASDIPRTLPPSYAILLQKSLFAPPGQPAAKGRSDDGTPSRPESRFVLRGVSQQAGRFDAFVEDVGAGGGNGGGGAGGHGLLRLGPGDAVARGRIRRVGFDGIEYEAGGRSVRVVIGQDLTGTPGPAVAAQMAKAGRAGKGGKGKPADAVPATAPNAPNAEAVNDGGSTGGDEAKALRKAAEKLRVQLTE